MEDRPHSHPNQHRPDVVKPIQDVRRWAPNAVLALFWMELAAARLYTVDLRPVPFSAKEQPDDGRRRC